MIGVFLFAGLCAAYIGGACFFRKKGKPSIWNSLVFGGVMLLLAMICRRNYLFRLPSLEYKSSIMIMIYASLPALVAGYYGSYMKEGMAYKWNTLFIRPLVIDIGFAGLALPYLHDISVMRKGFMVGVIPLTVGMIVVIVAEVILNMADREYKMTLRRQIIGVSI